MVARLSPCWAGYLLIRWLGRKRLDQARIDAERTIRDAEAEADRIRKSAEVDARAEIVRGQEQIQREADQVRTGFKETEARLAKREDNLEAKLDTLVHEGA